MAYHRPIQSSSSALHFLNSPFGDTTFTKVFVGGLAWETKSETLRRHFEQYGEILEAVVISDRNTGRSKGYGFVTFRDPESARRACTDPSPIIDGRRANCNLASLGRPRAATSFALNNISLEPTIAFDAVLCQEGSLEIHFFVSEDLEHGVELLILGHG